ncbi:hypothetical protein BK636_24245 [Pseudomonas chlororaphis]|uniref:hypothetical protein n=1 Tax=Pseudomonas chlororaphis TaxID=587753 RepID=UPI000F466530|nr:hypothetical protein [Pseudomonas chlororaphis]ROL77924.1 hypothetical protein BK636_24245 [Pseudomonas chlororaphis]WDH32450.1 hypothetical protein PUP62_16430 [Pseudomonas chlororaphis]WDH38534.1 hypothetical protein PUP51_16435 [Pseudomonas chlororaphis]
MLHEVPCPQQCPESLELQWAWCNAGVEDGFSGIAVGDKLARKSPELLETLQQGDSLMRGRNEPVKTTKPRIQFGLIER